MRHRRIYISLLVLLILLAALKSRALFTYERVERGKSSGQYESSWYSLISEEFNKGRIRLRVDGREIGTGNARLFMTEEGRFMLPVSLLTSAFACSARIYQGTDLVMMKGALRSRIREGEKSVEVNGVELALRDPMKTIEGIRYIPAEALEKGLGYEFSWEADEAALEFYSKEEQRILPYAYDYREEDRAPRVKNQGTLGTCWAFASLMALESRLLPEETFDFSEDHMSLRNSFHMRQNDGGEYTMSMAYLLAWQGPVLEKDDPYGDGLSPKGLRPVKHVQEIQILPSKDQEEIKRAIFFYGGVQSSLYTSMISGQSGSQYYNKEKGAYCYMGTAKPNHDVVIIGWDDNYPKENFNLQPEGDGAFICANSWGGEFGDEGYFYVSYYDTNIGIHNILYTRVEDTKHYDNIYQTDLCGWVGQLGYGKDNAYFANVYEARREEELTAAGFYATGPDTSYEIYTAGKVDENGNFSEKRLAARGVLRNAGYYTIDFEKPVKLLPGQRFAVIVYISTPGSVHPVAIEYNAPDKALKVDLKDGEGYISFRGSSWERVEKSQNCNVCLKAYTRNAVAEENSEVEENDG